MDYFKLFTNFDTFRGIYGSGPNDFIRETNKLFYLIVYTENYFIIARRQNKRRLKIKLTLTGLLLSK